MDVNDVAIPNIFLCPRLKCNVYSVLSIKCNTTSKARISLREQYYLKARSIAAISAIYGKNCLAAAARMSRLLSKTQTIESMRIKE